MPAPHSWWRAGAGELIGTAMLTLTIVGSGIAATHLTSDAGLRLAINAGATGLALSVTILVFGPVSGAHLNPVVTLIDAVLGRRPWRHIGVYLPAQFAGGALGVILANTIFAHAPVSISSTNRLTLAHLAAEIIATAGLVLVIFALARNGNHRSVAVAVGAYIAAAYFFTSSTSFANPAVTIARMLTDSFAGIAPASALAFLAPQLAGAVLGGLLAALLIPATSPPAVPAAARTDASTLQAQDP